MSTNNIIQLNKELIHHELKNLEESSSIKLAVGYRWV
jgi:hypothetical protein